VLYGSSTLLPSLLESLFGYDAFHAGLVLSPAGVFTILAIIIVGALLGRCLDARWLIGAGLLILAAGNFWMSQLNLDIAPWQVVWPRVVMVAGLGLVFAPLNVAAISTRRVPYAVPPSVSWRYCAMKEAALELRWDRRSLSAVRYFTPSG